MDIYEEESESSLKSMESESRIRLLWREFMTYMKFEWNETSSAFVKK